MLYKLVFLTFLLIVNVNKISADDTNYELSRHLLDVTDAPDDTGNAIDTNDGTDAPDDTTNDGTDAPDDTNDGTDAPDDTTEDDTNDGTDAPDDATEDDTDGNDNNDENDDGNDDTGLDDENDDVEDDENDNETTDSPDDDQATDSPDDASVIASISSDEPYASSSEVVGSASNSDSYEDECTGLEAVECEEQDDDEGYAECAFNTLTNTCNGMVRREGRFGSGNFDDGYMAAKDQAAKESSELTTLIGILGGIIGALILIIAGGGYYFYKEMKSDKRSISGIDNDGQTANVDTEEHMVMGINTEAPVKANDTDPMLS